MSELAGAEVGTFLAVNRWGTVELYRVEGLTKTQAVCGHARFSLKTGKLVGDDSRFPMYARIASEQDKTNARIKKAQNAISKVKVTADNLAAVQAFLNAVKETP